MLNDFYPAKTIFQEKMTDYGLVSIITPTYNSSKYIGETIESIQAQTYKNWELLITDDCSVDGSRDIIRTYMDKDPRIKLFTLDSNKGAGVARNNSIKEAKGRFIAFCDSDDRWTPDKLEKQLKFMVGNNFTLTYTSYLTCSEKGVINGIVNCLPEITRLKIIRDNGIGCLTAIYDKDKIGKVYMPEYRKRQDWCLWIDIISKTVPAKGLDECLAIYRLQTDSVSSGKIGLLKYNYDVYNKHLKHNPIASALMLGGFFLPYYFYKKIKQKFNFKKYQKTMNK